MRNEYLPETFSDILRAEKEADYNLTAKIVNGLIEKNIVLSPRTIQNYIQGKQVPEYQNAKEIIKVLNLSYNESALLQILNRSKQQLKEEKSTSISKTINPNEISYGRSNLKKRVSISGSEFTFMDDDSGEYAIDLIEQRIEEEYGKNKYSFNRYIRDLIDEDMKNYENFAQGEKNVKPNNKEENNE